VFANPWGTADALSFVRALMDAPGLRVLCETQRHAAVVAQTTNELPHLHGSRMHDVHIAVLMREHGVRRIYTRDRGFKEFPFLEAVDPLDL
jgi:predicted nucleic acid-binding protein